MVTTTCHNYVNYIIKMMPLENFGQIILNLSCAKETDHVSNFFRHSASKWLHSLHSVESLATKQRVTRAKIKFYSSHSCKQVRNVLCHIIASFAGYLWPLFGRSTLKTPLRKIAGSVLWKLANCRRNCQNVQRRRCTSRVPNIKNGTKEESRDKRETWNRSITLHVITICCNT